MPDMGSSYAQGYGIGQKDRFFDQESSNVYDRIYGNRRPMGGMVELKRDKTAKEMLEESKQQALKTKAMELSNKERELSMREMELNNAATRGLTTAQTGAMQYDTGRKERDEYRGLVTADEQKREQNLLNNAMRGFYTGDVQAVRDYFDSYGNPDVSIQDVITASNGQIIVDFGDGKEARFKNPREAIEKLLVPAQLIQQGIAGKMTESESIKAKQAERGLDIREKNAETSARNAKSLEEYRAGRGELTESQRASIEARARSQALNEVKEGIIETYDYEGRVQQLISELLPGNENDPYRQQAQDAINQGANPEEVKKRYKELTGRDF